MIVLSLGFSCQSRFAIDVCSASIVRYPFDYIISTKPFILSALASDGEAFNRSRSELKVYKGKNTGIGVGSPDVYFPHEYRNERGEIPLDWNSYVEETNLKFLTLWTRFRDVSRDVRTRKTYLISNTQDSIEEWTAGEEDFNRKFTIDMQFALSAKSTLDRFGAVNYSLLLVTRTIEEAIHLRSLERAQPEDYEVRFSGIAPYGGDSLLAHRMALPTYPPAWGEDIGEICCRYTNGCRIVRENRHSATVYKDDLPIGEARLSFGGFVFVFSGKPATIKKAENLTGTIRFDDKTNWFRQG